MLIGYVRVSTNDQNTDLQRNALNCAGCERILALLQIVGGDKLIIPFC